MLGAIVSTVFVVFNFSYQILILKQNCLKIQLVILNPVIFFYFIALQLLCCTHAYLLSPEKLCYIDLSQNNCCEFYTCCFVYLSSFIAQNTSLYCFLLHCINRLRGYICRGGDTCKLVILNSVIFFLF